MNDNSYLVRKLRGTHLHFLDSLTVKPFWTMLPKLSFRQSEATFKNSRIHNLVLEPHLMEINLRQDQDQLPSAHKEYYIPCLHDLNGESHSILD